MDACFVVGHWTLVLPSTSVATVSANEPYTTTTLSLALLLLSQSVVEAYACGVMHPDQYSG